MDREPGFTGDLTDRAQVLDRHHRPSGVAVGVLDRDEVDDLDVVGLVGQERRRHLLRAHPPPGVPHHRAERDPGQRRRAHHLGGRHVGARLRDDQVPRAPKVQAKADLVRHRAGRHVQGGLLAHHLGGAILEAADRRVVAEPVVADLGLGHGLAHGRRRLGHGVGTQVDAVGVHDRASIGRGPRRPIHHPRLSTGTSACRRRGGSSGGSSRRRTGLRRRRASPPGGPRRSGRSCSCRFGARPGGRTPRRSRGPPP